MATERVTPIIGVEHILTQEKKMLTTTYNELRNLGACKDGMETLRSWLLKGDTIPPCPRIFESPLTPHDILESNGYEHLWWAIRKIDSWWESYSAWQHNNNAVKAYYGCISRSSTDYNSRIISDWLDSLKCAQKKEWPRLDKFEHTVREALSQGIHIEQVTLDHDWQCCLRPGTHEVCGVKINWPKRKPRVLKAERILRAENVGTKWENHKGYHATVKVDGYGNPYLQWCSTGDGVVLEASNIACDWTEVIE